MLAVAAGLLDRPVGVVAIGRVADRERLRDRVGADGDQHVCIVLDHRHDRSAAEGLGRVDLRPHALDQAELLELLHGLPDLRDQRPPRARHHDVVGRPPAELLDDLVAVGLGALGVVRTEVDVDERPAVLVGDLGAEAVDLVVGALDLDEGRIVDERRHHLARLEIGGDEDVRLEAGLGRVRGHRVGEVARRRAGDRVVSKLLRLRQRDRDDAVLERPRRMADRVVLHPYLADPELLREVLRPHEGGEAHVVPDRDVALDRQQLAVPPHARRAGRDRLARDEALEGLVVVIDLEGTEAELTDVNGSCAVGAAAFAALQALQLLHGLSIGRGFEPRYRAAPTAIAQAVNM